MRCLKSDPHHSIVSNLAHKLRIQLAIMEGGSSTNSLSSMLSFSNSVGVFSSVYAEETFSAMKAETPKSILKIEDFFPARHKWSISTGTNIINSGDKGTSPAWYISEISPGNFVIDRTLRYWSKESNGVSAYGNVKYGLTDRFSLSATLSGQWMNTRYTAENGNSVTKCRYGADGVGLGGSYQFYRLSDYSVFYGGMNVKNDDINNYIFGTSFNWIYDPLVLGLSLGFLDGISIERSSTGYRAYTSSGNIIFAVNPEVNISWGVSKDFIFTHHIYNNENSVISHMSLIMGTSINLVRNVIGNISIKGGIGNNKTSTLSLNLHYKM